MFELLNKNGYSKFLLEKLSKETLDKLLNTQKDIDCVSVKISEPLKSHILVIPYSEGFKDFRNSVLKVLDSSRFKIISQSKKSLNMFSNKCRTPMGLASDLVYQFTCNGCNATYIGETTRHLCTRAQEHSRIKGSSNIIEHRKKCNGLTNLNNLT